MTNLTKPPTGTAIWLFVLLLAGAMGARAQLTGSKAKELLQELRSMDKGRQKSDDVSEWFGQRTYYDMHGNADGLIQELMIARFGPTRLICEELESPKIDELRDYRAMLFRTLGTVKDPASIRWLRSNLPKRKKQIVTEYLPQWGTYGLRGAETEILPWLTGASQWSAFFVEWAKHESDKEVRSDLLKVIHSWFHTPEILSFFRDLQNDPAVRDGDYLLAELYLSQHGASGDPEKFRAAIIRLTNKDDLSFKKAVADEMCHEAFVPWLIDSVEENPKEGSETHQWILERTTLRHDVRGRKAWKQWAADNLTRGRVAWVKQASDDILQRAGKDPKAARAFLDKKMYLWKGPDMLPTMKRLVEYPALHSVIVGWINLTYAHYSHVPGLVDALKELGLRIQKESTGTLEPWAKRIMEGWGFLGAKQRTWKEFITISNMRV